MDHFSKTLAWQDSDESFDDIIHTPGHVGTVGHVRLILAAENGSREFDTEVNTFSFKGVTVGFVKV